MSYISSQDWQMLFGYAEHLNDFRVLIPYRGPLTNWMKTHYNTPDFKEIARIGSHRAMRHRWCGDQCDQVQYMIDLADTDKDENYQKAKEWWVNKDKKDGS